MCYYAIGVCNLGVPYYMRGSRWIEWETLLIRRWGRINTTLSLSLSLFVCVSPVFHRPAGAAAAEDPGSPREDVPRDAGTLPQPGGPPESLTTHSRRTGSTATEGIYAHMHNAKSSSSLCYRASNVGWSIVRNYQLEFHLRNGKSCEVSFLLSYTQFPNDIHGCTMSALTHSHIASSFMQTVFFVVH